jgi:hypothetical protein
MKGEIANALTDNVTRILSVSAYAYALSLSEELTNWLVTVDAS